MREGVGGGISSRQWPIPHTQTHPNKTGPIPEPGNACPGLLPDGTMTSLPLPHLRTVTREVR